MNKFKRIFVIVIDSLGIGAMPDSEKFGDVGVNTLGHIAESVGSFHIPFLQPFEKPASNLFIFRTPDQILLLFRIF